MLSVSRHLLRDQHTTLVLSLGPHTRRMNSHLQIVLWPALVLYPPRLKIIKCFKNVASDILASIFIYTCVLNTHVCPSHKHVHTSVQLAIWSIKSWLIMILWIHLWWLSSLNRSHPFPDWIQTLVAKMHPYSFVFQEAEKSGVKECQCERVWVCSSVIFHGQVWSVFKHNCMM